MTELSNPLLSLLLDENVSPQVAEQINIKRPEITITSVARWQGGVYLGQTDAALLRAASEHGLTLVTYDQKTIPPLLVAWAMEGTGHAGVVFVDDKTILPRDIGGLVRALCFLWDGAKEADWTNRVAFLQLPQT